MFILSSAPPRDADAVQSVWRRTFQVEKRSSGARVSTREPNGHFVLESSSHAALPDRLPGNHVLSPQPARKVSGVGVGRAVGGDECRGRRHTRRGVHVRKANSTTSAPAQEERHSRRDVATFMQTPRGSSS